MNAPEQSCEIILVMGVQRSGTNVLFDSLATDKTLAAFPEDIDSAAYFNFRLRPVAELASIKPMLGRLLLKPISETLVRSLADVAEEYGAYVLRFVWIYRDPVNVLHSAYRQKWLAAHEVSDPSHVALWKKRNEYALEFQREHPEQIAIVRYEDLCVDRAVFRKLCGWLNVNCKSYFRSDSSQGRAQLTVSVQNAIDANTAGTVRALDAARRFPASRVFQLKSRIVSALKNRASVEGATASRENTRSAVSSQPARSPPSVEGLHFWLHAPAVCKRHGRLTEEVKEAGPQQMVAATGENGPYALLSLNHRGTVYYPHTKVEQRRTGPTGTLIFGAGRDWSFFFDGGGFAVFALFRPNVPCYPPYDQRSGTLLRVGPRHGLLPAFFLQWDANSNSSKAVILRPRQDGTPNSEVVSTPPGFHMRQDWAVVAVKCSGSGELSIAVNGFAGERKERVHNLGKPMCSDCVLEIGGFSAEAEQLFYGEIAEIIIFRRPLTEESCVGVTRYLIESHQL